jgi:acetylornithine deacetylase/succinyl-diaminopimelate desuccinylase-like protein
VIGAEGTELGLGLAEAGFVEVWFRVAGRSVHGALREEGDNAIEKALELVAEVQAQPFADWSHPLCGRNIPMVWEIGGGASLNVVPDTCDVHVDIRVVPGGPSVREILETCERLGRRHDARVDVVEISEPFETPASSPLATALVAAAEAATGRRPAPFGMLAWTDAHSFVDLAASDAVVFGPGHLRDAHRPDERVDLDEIVDCARTFSILIARSQALLEAAGGEPLPAPAAEGSP